MSLINRAKLIWKIVNSYTAHDNIGVQYRI